MNIEKITSIKSFLRNNLDTVYMFKYSGNKYKLVSNTALELKLYQRDMGLDFEIREHGLDLNNLLEELQNKSITDQLDEILYNAEQLNMEVENV